MLEHRTPVAEMNCKYACNQKSKVLEIFFYYRSYLGEFVGLAATCFPPLGLSFTKFRHDANLDSKA